MLVDNFVDDFPSGLPRAVDLTNTKMKVSSFINDDRKWNIDKVRDVFWPLVAAAICRTPIRREGDDRCCWTFEEKGGYSVKSGYLAEIGYYVEKSATSEARNEGWHNLVWKINIPPKTKIFLWRCLNDIIPTMVNLRTHHVNVNGLCEGCKKDWGTTVHCLLFCKKIKHFWRPTLYWNFLKPMRGKCMMEIVIDMRKRLDQTGYEVWVMMMAAVWHYICDLKHAPDGERVDARMDRVKDELQQFIKARNALHITNPFGVSVGSKTWAPAGVGVFRLDVDASVDHDQRKYGLGAVVRDEHGQVRAALATSISRPDSVYDAEVMAILYGVKLCLQEGLGPIMVFSDSLLAIRMFKGVDVIEHHLEKEFPVIDNSIKDGVICDFRHMCREANEVAHTLARFGANSDSYCTWNCNFPSFLRALID